MKNISVRETQSGGDFEISSQKGMKLDDYLPTAVYIALFGGNVEGNSQEKYKRYEMNNGYFGNCLLQKKYNSDTERVIFNSVNVVLSYEDIKRAVRLDLKKLQPKAIKEVLSVDVEADNSPKRVKITISATTISGENIKIEV